MRHNLTLKKKRQACAVVILRDNHHCHRYCCPLEKLEKKHGPLNKQTNHNLLTPIFRGGYCDIVGQEAQTDD